MEEGEREIAREGEGAVEAGNGRMRKFELTGSSHEKPCQCYVLDIPRHWCGFSVW